MTHLDPDLAPTGESFEAAYTFPPDLLPQLRELHGEMITQLRNEARALPMSTNSKMIIERLVHLYIMMKQGELTGSTTVTEQLRLLEMYLKYSAEFTKMINTNTAAGRQELLLTIKNVLTNAVGKISSAEDKRTIAQYLSAEFAKLDV